MATALDRAVWLTLQRSDLWEPLGHEAHALLTAQPDPHGTFFAWLDRVIHDQGALAPSGLQEALRASGEAGLAELQARVGAFHAMPAGDAARAELEAVLDGLRLRLVQDELERIVAATELSPEAKTRHRELLERQRILKERLAQPPSGR
jgi:hypothetical protein